MKISKRQMVYFTVIIAIAFFISTFQLDYYIYKPGKADPLDSIVKVDGGYESEGSMHLLTVSGGQATPLKYIMAKFMPYYEVVPLKNVRPEGETDEEYLQRQLQLMESSQESSKVVAYEMSDSKIDIEYNGVYVVSVVEDMPAEDILEIGDIIVNIDGEKINSSDQLIEYIDQKEAGDEITLDIERDDKILTESLQLKAFEAEEDKVGVGIQLVTNRSVVVEPEVHFSSGKIGGPSAGFIFALDIYDQLIEKDLTKGYQIAGTGQIDYEGNVSQIGGVDKKVVAADKQGCEIFFAPNEKVEGQSNYDLAVKTAKEIKTDMKIVPIDTFNDALEYLEQLDQKD